ncbi:energy transducer TonB [Luteimonas yindakuii]|uniref:Energy transducer TonB n=1 Tax=Luteimonas yindakuii TaxID=2565782 RepID=A0A4Z1RAW0_9GAMM|nr:energy transducer TonB [Luteimonas yindakuii]QCO67627.1 energy transducer TonB [Luteimonas yindakuii]TKS53898.1 energy transducer TonB [Luteimonas yindakuii]
MNDPRRPDDVRQPSGEPPRESLPRKSSSPLLWILLLIALIAVGWYFYSQRGPVTAPEAPPTPVGTAPEIGDGTPPPPASERRPREATPAPAAGVTRDASPVTPIDPGYPAAALRAREEGLVMLRATVDSDGRTGDIEIIESSRSRELDRAALAAVRDARFSPAMRDGKPIPSTVQVPVEFRLDANASAQR